MILKNVRLVSVKGLFSGDDNFVQYRLKKLIPDRKSIKLMNRTVQLGIVAARMTLEESDVWKKFPPSRRGMFVSASPAIRGQDDLHNALMASMVEGKFSYKSFAEQGRTHIHPLWLVRGLSNNILGFGTAFWDFQGENMNYCQGRSGGKHALIQAAHAICEGRLDVALVGGADSLIEAEEFLHKPCAEGAAFALLVSSKTDLKLDLDSIEKHEQKLSELGAGSWSIAFWKAYESNKCVLMTE
ncbi:MAG: hypothetical protein CL916_03125 [Deltaproteobacteria bacterium]|nr:hypothetical protein [Deltaproteobacteria bacterium]